MTLYELTSEYQQLLMMAEDPDIDLQVLADTFDAVEGDIEAKAEGYAKVIKQLEADITALKGEIDRLTARKKTIENNIDRLKERLKTAMILCDKPKFKTALFSFTVQNNPEKVILDSEEVPERYLVQQDPKINKTLLKEDLKSGVDLSGIAHLEQDSSLRIR